MSNDNIVKEQWQWSSVVSGGARDPSSNPSLYMNKICTKLKLFLIVPPMIALNSFNR